MKKLLSLFLAVLFVFSTLALSVAAAPVERNSKNIAQTNFLDFTPDTNQHWAKETDGKWECFIEEYNFEAPEDDEGRIIAPYLVPYERFNKNTSWSLTEAGEVLHFEVTGENTYPGLSFMFDEYRDGVFPAGLETASEPKAEYVKIRVRNNSTANKISFGFTAGHTNQYHFVEKTIATLTVDKNGKAYKPATGDWETYIFSYAEVNAATNHDGRLITDPTTGKIVEAWGGNIGEFLVFPFGYDVKDGSGAYPGASMDIDYIVIGSEEYVTNYKSDLELKEESITSLELVKEPTKKAYYVGDTLDLTGLELKATFKDGTSEILTSASYNVNLEKAAESTPVTLKFGSKSVTYDIKVTGVSSIEVIEEPESKIYEMDAVSNGFVPTGFKFQVNYADGTSSQEVPVSMFRCVAEDLTSAGKKNVTVNFYGITTTFEIDVINVTDLEITAPEKLYHYRDEVQVDDFTINYIYNDGSSKAKKDAKTNLDFTVTCDTKVPGDVKVTISSVNEKLGINIAKDVTIKVEAPVDMVITNEPIKKSYQPGETFDPSGMTVDFVYADGSKIQLNEEDFKARADLSAPGTARVSILCNIDGIDLKAKTEVTVEGAVPAESTNETTASTTETPAGESSGSSTVVIIIVVVAVVVIAGVVIAVVLSKKKKH